MEFTINNDNSNETIVYRGGNIPNLPVGEPISIQEFVAAYLEYANVSLAADVEIPASKVIVSNGAGVDCADQPGPTAVKSYLSNRGSVVQYNWDFSQTFAEASLPISLTRVVVTSGVATKGRLVDSASVSGSVPLGLEDFPISVKLETVFTSSCGAVTSDAYQTLDNPTDTAEYVIYTSPREAVQEATLETKLMQTDAVIAQLGSPILIDGKSMTIRDAILYLNSKIDS